MWPSIEIFIQCFFLCRFNVLLCSIIGCVHSAIRSEKSNSFRIHIHFNAHAYTMYIRHTFVQLFHSEYSDVHSHNLHLQLNWLRIFFSVCLFVWCALLTHCSRSIAIIQKSFVLYLSPQLIGLTAMNHSLSKGVLTIALSIGVQMPMA